MCLCLAFDGGFKAHRPFLVQLCLGHHMGKIRTGSDAAGQYMCGLIQPACRVNGIPEPPCQTFISTHAAPGVKQFSGAALSDDSRQHRACAHIAASQPHAGEQEGRFRLGRCKAHISCHRQNGTGANSDTVNSGDHRFAT